MRLSVPTLALLLAACSSGSTKAPPLDSADPGGAAGSADPFDPTALLEVEITLPDADWAALRAQTRDFEDALFGEDCMDEPFGSPFSWFEGAVLLDGERLGRVDVRKKGFLGSLSEERPSLKLDLGEYDATGAYRGERRLTLNNSKSDPAVVRQCLSYQAFADAGIPAPRCRLAHVVVNGEDLGVYVQVEPMKAPMLARHFESGEGALYEGTLSDIREGWLGTFEPKNDAAEADGGAAVAALAEAAAADDAELLDALDTVMDLDAFYRFWAVEILSQHGDGYTGNHNNFYLYVDPADGRAHFLPWGTDMTWGVWEAAHAGDEEDAEPLPPPEILTTSQLPYRLRSHPDGAERLADAMADVLANRWDPEGQQARIDQMLALATPVLGDGPAADLADEVAVVKARVADRGGELEEALERGLPPAWDPPPESYCWTEFGAAEISVSTTWGSVHTEDAFAYGTSAHWLDFEDGPPLDQAGTAVVGAYEGETILYAPTWTSDSEVLMLVVTLPEETPRANRFPVGFDEPFAALLYRDLDTPDDWAIAAYVVGSIDITAVELVEGGAFEATVEGTFVAP
jgi:hypothetical protein